MRAVRVGPGENAAALIAGAWAFGFARSHGIAAVAALGLLLTVTLLFVRRHPAPSGLTIAVLIAAGHFAVGVPGDNPWFLAGALVALYAVGRHGAAPATLPVLAALWTAFVSLDPTVATGLFGGVLVGVPWAFGAALRRRAAQVDRAGEQAAALARIDAEARAQRVVAEERARLAADVLAVIRAAVHGIQAEAARAEEDLDPDALAAIQGEGRQATGELRRLLGLLRSETTAEATTPAPAGNRGDGPRPWHADAVAAAALAAVYALEITAAASTGDVQLGPAAVALSLWFTVTVALRRTRPGVACLLAAIAPIAALVFDLRLGYGLWSAAAAALLVLSVTGDRDRVAWLAGGVWATAFLADVARHEPANVAITVATLVLAGIAGHGWGERTRARGAAQAASAALRAEHDAVAERALRADRLLLARELHDIASHAVGVMVLQAGAATALRDRDPLRARDAVGVIQSTAVEALSQVDSLLDLLDAGTVGAAGLAGAGAATDLNRSIEDLAERTRRAGLHVSLDHGEAPLGDAAVQATIYRIVQESLTNAMRHAPGSAVHVRVHHDVGHLVVSVHDDGARSTPTGGSQGGFGLVGLAERVAALGGELWTGPGTEGGFEVRALLPVNGVAETRG